MRATPYALVAVGLVGGLVVLQFAPLGSPMNILVGGACLGAALGGVLYLIAANSGPGKRGPDF